MGVSRGAKDRAAERRIKALELRKAGATYGAIARHLGVSELTAAKDCKRVLADLAVIERELGTEARQLVWERLDRLLVVVWPRAIGGDLQAVDRALRITQQRVKLLGLEAPAKISSESLVRGEARTPGLENLSVKDLETLQDILSRA